MKIKTSNLIGPALNWAVAKCEGYVNLRIGVFSNVLIMDPPRVERGAVDFSTLDYLGDWAQGGPIIEREKITLTWTGENWEGYIRHDEEFFGPTPPLVVAMRCYVASKLGDEIEIPEELK